MTGFHRAWLDVVLHPDWSTMNFWTRGRMVVEGNVPRTLVVLLQEILHSQDHTTPASIAREGSKLRRDEKKARLKL